MRRWFISTLVLVALLVVADRVAAAAAEHDVAKRIAADQNLDRDPDVSIRGFPFLTQLFGGRYDDVDVTVHGLHAGELTIARLTAHLAGAHVSFGDVVHQRVTRVPVDHATADVLLTYGDLNAFLADEHVTLRAGQPGRVHVSANVAGQSASADVPVNVSASALSFDVAGGLHVDIPLPGLPFKTHLESVQVRQDGLLVTGSADGLVLRT